MFGKKLLMLCFWGVGILSFTACSKASTDSKEQNIVQTVAGEGIEADNIENTDISPEYTFKFAYTANSHFPRPAGPHFPASQGHIKRPA